MPFSADSNVAEYDCDSCGKTRIAKHICVCERRDRCGDPFGGVFQSEHDARRKSALDRYNQLQNDRTPHAGLFASQPFHKVSTPPPVPLWAKAMKVDRKVPDAPPIVHHHYHFPQGGLNGPYLGRPGSFFSSSGV